jgi:hypothetical protein
MLDITPIPGLRPTGAERSLNALCPAAFRGWGALPFALLAIPFAPDLADVLS